MAGLAADGDLVISMVAVAAEKVVGHVALSRMSVFADGAAVRALGLGPVAVVPERQRSGIGAALIEAGLEEAARAGVEIVFVLGEPAYYSRFGFDAAGARPFASPYAGPYFMALTLTDMVAAREGRADYAPAFARLG